MVAVIFYVKTLSLRQQEWLGFLQALFDKEEHKLLIWALNILCCAPEAKATILRAYIYLFYLHTFVCISWYHMSATENTVKVLSLWKMTET